MIYFYDPLKIWYSNNIPTNIAEILTEWKAQYLKGWVLKYYNLEIKPQPTIKSWFRITLRFFKYFYPSIIMAVVAYFSFWSMLSLALFLLPLQLALFVLVLFKLYTLTVIVAVRELEKINSDY